MSITIIYEYLYRKNNWAKIYQKGLIDISLYIYILELNFFLYFLILSQRRYIYIYIYITLISNRKTFTFKNKGYITYRWLINR